MSESSWEVSALLSFPAVRPSVRSAFFLTAGASRPDVDWGRALLLLLLLQQRWKIQLNSGTVAVASNELEHCYCGYTTGCFHDLFTPLRVVSGPKRHAV